MKTYTFAAALFALTTGAGLMHADPHKKMTAVAPELKDIVAIASDANDFSTLVAAIKAAGLVETLQGEGPFTVFAPTNAAFEALPEGTIVKLLEPQNKQLLREILTYHIIPRKLLSENAAPMTLKTVEGSEITITVDGKAIMINGTKIIQSDIVASNGIIHVIDKVLIRPKPIKAAEAE